MKLYKKIAFIVGFALLSTSCVFGENYVPAHLITDIKAFEFAPDSKYLKIGTTGKINPVIVTNNGDILKDISGITWKVSDEKIAKIDKNGNITAIAEGEVTVTGTYAGKEFSTKLFITKEAVAVDANGKPITNINNGTGIYSNLVDTSLIKKITIQPEGVEESDTEEKPLVTDHTIKSLKGTVKLIGKAYDIDSNKLENVVFSWSSSDKSVAYVNSTGTVTALKTGTTNIIATAGDKTSNIMRITVPHASVNLNISF